MAGLEEQISSGVRVSLPSDDPVSAGRIVTLRSQRIRVEAYHDNVRRAQTLLRETERALSGTIQVLTNLKEKAVMASNDTLSAQDRLDVAQEVDEAYESILDLANTKVEGRYLFSGARYDDPAFDVNGVYQGDDTEIELDVGEQERVTVNVLGDRAFQGNGDVFEVVRDLAAALRANDTAAIGRSLDDLEAVTEGVISARSDVGYRAAHLDQVAAMLDQRQITVATGLSSEEDTDMADAIAEYKLQEQALTAALGVSARIVQPTLMDFLK